jgi:hypothetical protein
MGGFSYGGDIKLQLTNGVGLAIRLGVASDVLER